MAFAFDPFSAGPFGYAPIGPPGYDSGLLGLICRVVIVPTKLSERLRLAACSKPLQTHLPNRLGTPSRVAVAISCTGTPGWTIQVPVQMQVFRQVLVTSRPLARGV